MTKQRQRKAFTGWHMTAILVAFFGVVVTVNVTMARFAISTFGGKVVENSYVASQKYNEWLNRADAQDQLGWSYRAGFDADRHLTIDLVRDDVALSSPEVSATLSHPLGQRPPVQLNMQAQADGSLRSAEPVAAGRWRLDLIVRQGADEARFRGDVK